MGELLFCSDSCVHTSCLTANLGAFLGGGVVELVPSTQGFDVNEFL